MPRRLLVTFTLLAIAVVPACSLGGTGTGAVDVSGGSLATPTPLVAVGSGDTLPQGQFSIELDLKHLLVPTVGTNEPVTFSTVVPLSPEFTSTNLTGSGEGDIQDDVTFTVGEVTAHNVADWIIKVDATLDPAAAAEPLSLHFDLKGQGYATVDEIVQARCPHGCGRDRL
jgi:hypothetical protein